MTIFSSSFRNSENESGSDSAVGDKFWNTAVDEDNLGVEYGDFVFNSDKPENVS